MYTLNLNHSPENGKVWESADCVYPHAGHGQETLQDSDLPDPGVSDSIEADNYNGANLACCEAPVFKGMNVQRKRRHLNGLATVGREPV